jgi:transcriptional regulator with XRE-family HTH domain
MNLTQIGQTIKQRRNFLRILQKDLSEITGISLRSLIDIETGKGNPTINQLNKILDALGLTLKLTVEKDV